MSIRACLAGAGLVLVMAACSEGPRETSTQTPRSDLAQEIMSQLLPGLQPYTPTKIEWLALDLNATYRRDAIFDDKFKYEIFYVASDPDTILIAVQYFPDANRERMNLALDTAREVVESAAQSHGWQWVQIREQYLRQEYP